MEETSSDQGRAAEKRPKDGKSSRSPPKRSRSGRSPTSTSNPNSSQKRGGRSPQASLSRSTHSKRRVTNESKERTSRKIRSSSADNVRFYDDETSSSKKRSGRSSQKSLSRSEHSKRRDNESKKRTGRYARSSSADDIRLHDDGNEASGDVWSLDKPRKSKSSKKLSGLHTSQHGGDSSSTKKKQGMRSKSPNPQSAGRRNRKKGADNPKSKRNKSPTPRSTAGTLPTGVAEISSEQTEVLMAETVNEDREVIMERMRDLEVQSDQIQERMQNAAVKGKKGKKGKKSKNGDIVQETASDGGKRITIGKVLGIAAVYLAGVGTGYLISELRPRGAPVNEIYITQSPTAAVVPSYDPTTAPTEFSYDEPTEEDCFAIESKEEVDGQDGLITRSYDVRFDVQLNDSSTDWYGQMEDTMTNKVIPDLACCRAEPTEERLLLMEESTPVDFPIRGHFNRMLRNIRCVVANGATRGENNVSGENCVELTGGLCIPAVVTFDLALKGDEPNGDIMDLVRNVIQGDGSDPLVEKFDLERNVFSVVKLVDVVEHVPRTSRPTLSPTVSSAPVSGPSTNAPTRVVTQRPTARLATPTPTSAVSQSPTFQPAPGSTPVPSLQPNPDPTPPPSSQPSSGPTESPSAFPTVAPTILASSSPTSSPTTSSPSLTPSFSPTGRREVLEMILAPVVGTIDASALDWLADTDTWSPPAEEADPDSMWVERYGMVRIYSDMNGASWGNNYGWMTSTSICTWAKMTCDGNNRAYLMSLQRNGLSGIIPTEVGLFPSLRNFLVQANSIGGTLPTEIGLLPDLEYLRIDSNNISGRLPSELGGLPVLQEIFVAKNSFDGPIPLEVQSLSSLKSLRLNSNGFTGTIGSELGAMTECTTLSLHYNGFSGSLPTELGLLTKLTYMSFRDSPLTGTIPSELGLVTMLGELTLSYTGCSGTIPTTLGQLTKLSVLQLTESNLSGKVPTELGRLTALRTVFLDVITNLSGTIPSEMNLLTNLEYFEIGNTQISGSMPDLSALVNLKTLKTNNCGMSGSIPPGMFDDMASLVDLTLFGNDFTGAVPAGLGALTRCDLGANCFSDLTNAGTCDLTENC